MYLHVAICFVRTGTLSAEPTAHHAFPGLLPIPYIIPTTTKKEGEQSRLLSEVVEITFYGKDKMLACQRAFAHLSSVKVPD